MSMTSSSGRRLNHSAPAATADSARGLIEAGVGLNLSAQAEPQGVTHAASPQKSARRRRP